MATMHVELHNDVHFMWTTIACKLQCKLQGMNKQWNFYSFPNSQTHTLVTSSSCTTKTCYTKNHHYNGLLHLHNLCIHKTFEKHTLLEFAHHLHMFPVTFFSMYVLQQIHVSLNQVGTMTCSLSTLLVLHTWKHFLSIETHPFCYTPIPPYYPKFQTPWFLGPFWVQFPRPNRPKPAKKIKIISKTLK